jgi:hypothetical protein
MKVHDLLVIANDTPESHLVTEIAMDVVTLLLPRQKSGPTIAWDLAWFLGKSSPSCF